MKFYISDLHFGHENIIRLCNRPFSSVEEMDKAMIDNWNAVVKPNDEVYILGDFCFKGVNSAESYVKKLNGKKYLICGNHDKMNSELRKCFEWVRDYAEVHDEGKKIVLSHYPMVEWNGFFHGSLHFYGHIHNSTDTTAYKVMKEIQNAFNVGADILGFTPRTLGAVIDCNVRFNRVA